MLVPKAKLESNRMAPGWFRTTDGDTSVPVDDSKRGSGEVRIKKIEQCKKNKEKIRVVPFFLCLSLSLSSMTYFICTIGLH